MKTGKAAGRDNIVPEFIKFGRPELVEALQKFFQRVWDNERISKEWEFIVIIPIHKNGSQSDCSNYKPIYLSPVLYKIYTFILENQFRPLVEPDLLEQSAFRPVRQTNYHIFTLRNVIEKSWDRDQNIYLAFLDLKAALDLVLQNEILESLKAKYIE